LNESLSEYDQFWNTDPNGSFSYSFNYQDYDLVAEVTRLDGTTGHYTAVEYLHTASSPPYMTNDTLIYQIQGTLTLTFPPPAFPLVGALPYFITPFFPPVDWFGHGFWAWYGHNGWDDPFGRSVPYGGTLNAGNFLMDPYSRSWDRLNQALHRLTGPTD